MHNKYVWLLKIALDSRRNVQEFTKPHLNQAALQVAEWRLILRQVHKGRKTAIQKHKAAMKDTEMDFQIRGLEVSREGFNNKFLNTLQKSENIFSPPGEVKNVHIN